MIAAADVVIPIEFVVIAMGAVLTVGIALMSWTLITVVRLTNAVGVLEARISMHAELLDDLELNHRGYPKYQPIVQPRG